MSSISLGDISERFKQWRQVRKGREKIPDELWQFLGEATSVLPVSMVAKAANVDYYQLKQRITGQSERTSSSPLSISKIVTVPLPSQSQFPIEIEHPSGFKIRVDPNHMGAVSFLSELLQGGAIRNAQFLVGNTRVRRTRTR
ncbi:MAG: hypothetical protein RJB13_439 [Pseudomonadota bacterium]|jgi:hypothetical protein